MLIDEATIFVQAGNGGDGKVAFDTNRGSKGPKGGSGGAGGSVYMEAVSDLSALQQFRYKKKFSAANGENGKPMCLDGADAEDLILHVPIGTVIRLSENRKEFDLVAVGDKVMIAKGGKGGRGNFLFRSSTNTTPMEFEAGTSGEVCNLTLELRLIADAGLIGLPNAGKSSLLNALTRASAKVASYPFTTLEPNLGVYQYTQKANGKAQSAEEGKPAALILADIPGLIEGASAGKGLGVKFLRHIQRTRCLIHCISAESTDLEGDYHTIRHELASHDPELIKKPEHIFLTKIDLLDAEEKAKKIAQLQKLNPSVLAVSIKQKETLEEVKRFLEHLNEG